MADLPDDLTGARVRARKGFWTFTGDVVEDRGKWVRFRGGRTFRRSQIECVLSSPPAGRLHRQPNPAQPTELVEQPKDGPREHRAYLGWIRSLPCAWCGAAPPSEAHHWPHRGTGGVHAADTQTVPLCGPMGCHEQYHRTGTLGQMDGEQTRVWFRDQQIRLMSEWIFGRGRAA